MNTELYSTSSESQRVRVTSYVYISTAKSKKYFSGSENKKIITAKAWKLPNIIPSNKKIYMQGAHHTILPRAISFLATPLTTAGVLSSFLPFFFHSMIYSFLHVTEPHYSVLQRLYTVIPAAGSVG
jgi:hypothetical protein